MDDILMLAIILFQKRMRVKRLPTILALHLKRFKYMEQYNRHIKVSHRVVFPLELRLFNTVSIQSLAGIQCTQHSVKRYEAAVPILKFHIFQSDDAVNPDRMYDLVAVVIHCGSGPNRGHCKYRYMYSAGFYTFS